jgi:IS30 family transposase
MHKQINYAERYALAVCLKDGLSYREISGKLGRSPNTWSYEVINNGGSREDYNPHLAQLSASLRKWEANSKNPAKDKRVWDFVLENLKKRHSPEQISNDLITQYPNDKAMRISYETIYAFINSEEGKEMNLVKLLRHKRLRKLRKAGMKALEPKKVKIPNRISIRERPEVVNNKERFGDWESDLMEGKRFTADCLCVLKERLSQYMIIMRISAKTSKENVRAILQGLASFPEAMRFTITYDNGSENVEHEKINNILGTKSYFCDAYASWQKGSVENGIGLIRDYLPKKTDLTQVSDAKLRRIQNELNNRPRKCLGWKTPRQVLSKHLKNLGVLIPV